MPYLCLCHNKHKQNLMLCFSVYEILQFCEVQNITITTGGYLPVAKSCYIYFFLMTLTFGNMDAEMRMTRIQTESCEKKSK